MKIVHLPSSYFPDSVGGTETYVATLVKDLEALGHESQVLVHRQGPPTTEQSVVALPPLEEYSTTALYDGFSAAHADGTALTAFRGALKEWRPDVVHFHARTLGAGLDHMRVAEELGIPTVVTYHTPTQSCPRGTLLEHGETVCDGEVSTHRCSRCVLTGHHRLAPLAYWLSRSPLTSPPVPGRLATVLAHPHLIRRNRRAISRFFGGAGAIIACADFCADVLERNGVDRSKVTVLRQGLPGSTRMRALRPFTRSLQRGEPIRIGYFGRINHDKGPDLLQEAVDRLRSKGVPVTAEFAGPIEGSFSHWEESLDSQRHCYRGLLRGNDLLEWLQSVDLVVVPSRWLETGPLTLLEAWDQGTPVMGANAGGIRDFMTANGQDHMLFERNSASDLAKKIHQWVQSDGSRSGEVEVPGMESVATAHEQIYARLRSTR